MTLPSFTRKPQLWFAAWAIWAVALYLLSSQPKLPSPNIGNFDKFAHATYFLAGGLALGIGLALSKGRVTTAILVTVLVSAAVVGGLDEWHQSFVPGRTGNDIPDFIADVFGGVLACLCLRPALKVLGHS